MSHTNMTFFKEVQFVPMGTWRWTRANRVLEVFDFVNLVQQKKTALRKTIKPTRNYRDMTSGKVAFQKRGLAFQKKTTSCHHHLPGACRKWSRGLRGKGKSAEASAPSIGNGKENGEKKQGAR